MKTLRQFVEEAKQLDIEEDVDQIDPEEYYTDEDEYDEDEAIEEDLKAPREVSTGEFNARTKKALPAPMPMKPPSNSSKGKLELPPGKRPQPGEKGPKLKPLEEAHDIELKPHPTKKTHYLVHKISKKSGIKNDQLKVGEALNDTHVDDLNDMGYSVKIHNK